MSPAGGSGFAPAGVGGQGEVGSGEGGCGGVWREDWRRVRCTAEIVLWQCICPWGVGAKTSDHLDLRSSQGWLSQHPEVFSCQKLLLMKIFTLAFS